MMKMNFSSLDEEEYENLFLYIWSREVDTLYCHNKIKCIRTSDTNINALQLVVFIVESKLK